MARRLIAVGLCAALQVGAWCAPLVHAHLDSHHADHHDAPAVHAHAGGHPQGPAHAGHPEGDRLTIASQDEPEQATRLQIFVAVAASTLTIPSLPPVRFTLPPVLESGSHRLPELVRSHGPPALGPAESRAPPTPSVLI